MNEFDASRDVLRAMLKKKYSNCETGHFEDEYRPPSEERILYVLPCLHIFCEGCLLKYIGRGRSKKCRRNPNRIECHICHWPIYLHGTGREREDEEIKFPPFPFPRRLPLHEDLIAMDELERPAHLPADPIVRQPVSQKDFKPPRFYGTHLTRNGNYYLWKVVGEFGNDVFNGQLRSVTGMVVDENPKKPDKSVIVLIEGRFDHIILYNMEGEKGTLIKSERIWFKIWDVCLGDPKGSLVVSVGERDYSLAHYKPPLFKGPNDVGCHPGIFKPENVDLPEHDRIFVDNEFKQGAMNQLEPYGVIRDSQGRYLISMLCVDKIFRIDPTKRPHIYDYGRLGLVGPYHLAKLSNGHIVVSCKLEHKIKIVEETPDGRRAARVVREWGGLGTDLVSLCYPHGVFVDDQDQIYVADSGNFRVIVFDQYSNYVSMPVYETWNYGEKVRPTHVSVLKNGTLLVMMQGEVYLGVHVYKVREEEPICCDCGPEGCWENWWKMCTGRYRNDYERYLHKSKHRRPDRREYEPINDPLI